MATLGYRLGLHAPGHRDLREAFVASHHQLVAHGLAVAAFRASGARGRIGPAPNLLPTYPATDSGDDAAAAIGSDGYTNRWFLDPLFRGGYPDDTRELVERLTGPMDYELPGDPALIAQPIDLLGINYYSRRVVRAGEGDTFPWTVVPASSAVPTTDAGWEIVPDSLVDVLTRVKRDYGADLPPCDRERCRLPRPARARWPHRGYRSSPLPAGPPRRRAPGDRGRGAAGGLRPLVAAR